MATETLTIAGAVNFLGGAGNGLFDFSRYNRIPRTTRIALLSVGYTELVADPITTEIRVWAVRPGGAPTERMLVGRGLFDDGLLDPDDGNAYLRLCGIIIPREPGNDGAHWNIEVISTGKANTGTLIIDHALNPAPDTSGSDSAR